MSTGIQWTDEVWNPVVGCTKVSQGCKNCYAKTVHDNRHKALLGGNTKMAPQYAEPFETVQLLPSRLTKPLGWRKPRKVFVNSVSDLFHEDVPDEFIDRVFAVMALCPQHTFQVLTKRPERMRRYLTGERVEAVADAGVVLMDTPGMVPNVAHFTADMYIRCTTTGWPFPSWPLPNVWLGVSVEDQAAADERIPLLLQTPAAVRFLSCEPLLGPVDLTEMVLHESLREKHPYDPIMRFNAFTGLMSGMDEYVFGKVGIDWVIGGGESGGKARPCDVGWIRSVVAHCREAGVPVFVKQLGSKPLFPCSCGNSGSYADTQPMCEEPRHKLRHSHGGDPEEWPADLRIREFPALTPAAADPLPALTREGAKAVS